MHKSLGIKIIHHNTPQPLCISHSPTCFLMARIGPGRRKYAGISKKSFLVPALAIFWWNGHLKSRNLVEYFMVIGYLFHFNCLLSHIECVLTQINTIYGFKFEKWRKNRQKLIKLSISLKKWSKFWTFSQKKGQIVDQKS